MKRTLVFAQTAKIHQSLDIEYDSEKQIDDALELTKNCYDVYGAAVILERNSFKVSNVDEEVGFDVDDFEYYDDYDSEEED